MNRTEKEDDGGTKEKEDQKVVTARPRIEGLSDLIFGLALSIGAIQLLGVPTQSTVQLLTVIGSFGGSFSILIGLWSRYTTITSVMPIETDVMVRLNMVLLFLVAIEPFLFNILVFQSGGDQLSVAEEASIIYGFDLACMNLILAFFSHSLTRGIGGKKIATEQIEQFKISRNVLVLVSLIFVFSLLPFFWTSDILGVRIRYLLWFLTLPMFWFYRLLLKIFS